MNRRQFFKRVLEGGASLWVMGVAGACGKESATEKSEARARLFFEDGTPRGEVIMYDTYAMALYMDGGLGPKTGTIKVDYILANESVTLDFWHGHGGRVHKFTLTPEHFSEMKKLKKVTLETTVVDSHKHKLFIDFGDSKWRVPGAKPIHVPTETIS